MNGTTALRLQSHQPALGESLLPCDPQHHSNGQLPVTDQPRAAARQARQNSRINGLGNITFKKLNLDVYLLYALKNDKIAVTADVEPDFAGLDVDVDW